MNAELKLSPLSRDTDPFQRRILNMILDFNCDFDMTCSKNNKIKPMFRSYDDKNPSESFSCFQSFANACLNL